MTSSATRELHLTIASRFENIELVQAVVDEALKEKGVADDTRHWVGLALREAVANAIKHGNRQDPEKQVEIEATIDSGRLELRIADEGDGFDPSAVADPLAEENRFRASGRGIFYMKRFMDEVEYATSPSGGTALTLRKRLEPAEGASQER
jgi:serine/threonine-protein kinase RsbW